MKNVMKRKHLTLDVKYIEQTVMKYVSHHLEAEQKP